MRSAGLHPGLMFGGGGAAMSSGGNAGSSSKDKEEEEKRKKKKKRQEEEERYKAQIKAERQRETMRILGRIASMAVLGSTRAVGSAVMSNSRKSKSVNVNKPKWTDKYMKELEDMEG